MRYTVGGIEQQKYFIDELLRVAACVYIIVPNSFFPSSTTPRSSISRTFRIACVL